MNCLKCGREIDAQDVFCSQCLKDMEKYPVKPGTAVHIPARREESAAPKPQPRKKTVTPEQQVVKLRKKVRSLTVTLILVLALFAGAVVGGLELLKNAYESLPLGQNYSAASDPTGTTEATETTE